MGLFLGKKGKKRAQEIAQSSSVKEAEKGIKAKNVINTAIITVAGLVVTFVGAQFGLGEEIETGKEITEDVFEVYKDNQGKSVSGLIIALVTTVVGMIFKDTWIGRKFGKKD